MTLSTGTKLSHYEIKSQIGKGGMGEVYQATDTKIGRDVAIKVLPEEFTRDADRVARFQREAKLLASLNHPNIAAIHGLEEVDGTNFLVMELVEGQTLDDRIKSGSIPVEEALKLALQIAEALEAAHEKGVIHRDLKPANIKVTPDGKVKVLDFGLAKAFAGEQADLNLSNSPTISVAATQQGVILGTAAYMSPEQARGKEVDKRADIWAFGVVLFEMLTGKHLFSGDTVSDTLAGVLTKEPAWEKIPVKAQPLLRRCLERDPKHRLRDIGEAMAWVESAPDTNHVFSPEKRPSFQWKWIAIPVLLLVLAILLLLHLGRRESAQAKTFDITVPRTPSEYSIAISPNSHWIAFVAFSSESVPCLFVRHIGSGAVSRIDGTEGARSPFWSPDSNSIGFFAGDKLKKVEVAGGAPQDICSVSDLAFGGAWSTNGVILFADFPVLHCVSADKAEESAPITSLDRSRKEMNHLLPNFLPDGDHYVYLVASGSVSRNDIYLGSISTRKQIHLLDRAQKAVYVEPGYMIFQRDKALFAQPFDPDKLELVGEPLRIAENLLISNQIFGNADFGASQNGILVYRSSPIESGAQFVWLDRNGNQIGITEESSSFGSGFDLSPDGKKIACPNCDSRTNSCDVWTLEYERGLPARLNFDPAIDACVVWSDDGHRIGFSSNRNGNMDIFIKNASGMGEETPLTSTPEDEWLKDWSKDGRYIAYGTSDGNFIMPLSDGNPGEPFQILPSQFAVNMLNFSYDGKWIAYNSNESGIWQVYIAPFPAADQRYPISIKGGAQPRWKRDGSELYYLSSDGKMMAVDLKLDDEIKPGDPYVLFDTGLTVVDPTNNQYEVTADGRRFVVLKPLADAASIPFKVVTDWTALLKK